MNRTLRAASRFATCLALAGPLAATSTWASRLPDWAAAIAAGAPALPPGVPTSASRILLSETRYAVQPDGSYRIRRRLAIQAMSVDTEDVGTGWYAFEDTAKVTATRAWHLPPDDSAKKSHSTPVDITIGDAFLSSSKARAIPVDGVKKGSLVFFEFEATEKPYFLNLLELFYEGVPVIRARFEVETPAGWTVRPVWLRGKGPEPVVSGLVRAWELSDLPAPVEEEMALEPQEVAPLLGVNLLPPPGPSVGTAFPDWSAVSLWYEGLAQERRKVTPAIQSAAHKAIPAGSPAPANPILPVATWVRDHVRYVAVELGIGGFQPRSATDTLSNLYGDCKDKATMLQAMLSAEGVSSYPVLVNVGGRESLSDQIPVWQFNHLVVAVALPKDLELPPRFAPSRIDDPDLGHLLIVDSTDEFTSVGSLSAGLAGQRALLSAGPKAKLITLPPAEPSFHRLERHFEMEVQPDGTLTLREESKLYGQFAANARAAYLQSSLDRRRRVEQRWAELWPGASIADYAVEMETPDGAFVERVKVSRGASVGSSHAPLLELFPGASWDLPRVSLGKRKDGVDYEFPRTLRYDASVTGIPADLALPEPQSLQGEGWEGKTTFRREGDKVLASCEIRLARALFPPEAFPDLRKFWSGVSMLESGAVYVRR